MKTWFNRTFFLLAGLLVFAACEKEEERAIFNEEAGTTLSSSTAEVVLTEDMKDEEVISFVWTPIDFGFQASSANAIQFGISGDDFSDVVSAPVVRGLESVVSAAELNVIALQLGLVPDEAGQLDVRLISIVSDQVDTVFSNVISLTVTPYSTEISYPTIYVPGGYQGWDPASAAKLISVEDDGIYEGYVNIEGEDLGFKFTENPDWTVNYGAGEPGVLVDNGQTNLSVPTAGTYLMTVNLNDLTWSSDEHSWGLVGDATPGGWPPETGDQTDTPMTFDNEEGVWKIEVDLTVGQLKFRLNKNWSVNYGDDNPEDDALNLGSSNNIPVTEAGTYEVILNLKNTELPIYTITKN